MGISRDSRHKRRLTGGRRHDNQSKRKFEMGRPPANTKLTHDEKRVHLVRTRGGNVKFRALRLDKGNFAWGSEQCTRKVRILDVVYNSTNNELVRTKTLVKNAIVEIDAAEFKKFYESTYGVVLAKKGTTLAEPPAGKGAKARLEAKQATRVLDPLIEAQLAGQGRLLAAIASRPGQSGRADGYVLEGKELEFYQKIMAQKKKGKAKEKA